MNLAGLFANFTYAATTLLLIIGLYGMIGKRNLVKKLIGLSIFQTAIFLFYIHGAVQPEGTVPVWDARFITAAQYINPLPHVLILTAIVVSVATTGVALALSVAIYRRYGTLDEAALLERMKQES